MSTFRKCESEKGQLQVCYFENPKIEAFEAFGKIASLGSINSLLPPSQ